MTLDGIEKLLSENFPKNKYDRIEGKRTAKYKVNFVRYADDFIITANTEEIAKEAKELIKDFLKDRGLELSDEKTLITHIDDGFDFLGWNFRKYNGKLLVKPSKKSIDKFIEKISDTIKVGKAWQHEVLINALNPVITGWANYHQSVVSSEIFHKLIQEYGVCSGIGLKEDTLRNPNIGLPRNTGIQSERRNGYFLMARNNYVSF